MTNFEAWKQGLTVKDAEQFIGDCEHCFLYSHCDKFEPDDQEETRTCEDVLRDWANAEAPQPRL